MAAFAFTALALLPVALTLGLLLALEVVSGQDLPILGWMAVVLLTRQLTVFTVTALYHRGYAHRSVVFHPALGSALRVWGWLTTGLGVTTWALVHRWHHAESDGPEAPFSPSRPGGSLWRIGRETIAAHRLAVTEPDRLRRFAAGLPDDALERFVQADERRWFGVLGVRLPLFVGLTTAAASLALPPSTALLAVLASLPAVLGSVAVGSVFGVNGIGHLAGRRPFDTRDTSHNVLRWDFLAMGEALHNNHHARPGSAKLSVGPGELDPGFEVLRVLQAVGAVRELRYGVDPVPPVPVPPSQS